MRPFNRLLIPLLVAFQLALFCAANLSADITSVRIQTIEDAIPGVLDTVDVFVSKGSMQLGAFDFMVAYDDAKLNFQKAFPSKKMYGDSSYAWEYFTFRFRRPVDCTVEDCPKVTLRIIGIADINDPYRPTGYDIAENDVLCSMVFQIADDRHLHCQFIPLRFYWTDCGDNTLLTRYRDTLSISQGVYDDSVTNIADPQATLGYPTYHGAQNIDCDSANTRFSKVRQVDLFNGGIRFACPETLDVRGDVNLNGYSFEIADVVVYSNYFLYGKSVFPSTIPYPLSATDVNGDGVTLTLADLIYCIRMVVGDALPIPPVDSVAIDYTFEDGVLAVAAPVGAAYAVVSGRSEVDNLSPMQLRWVYDTEQDVTRVLLFDLGRGNEAEGPLLQFAGDQIVSVELATYDGAPVSAKRVHIPDQFLLLANYPNPFNSTTVITFGLPVRSDYRLCIFNTHGQIIKTYSGTEDAGMVSHNWDAGNYASGVYFYRLQAGGYSETRKMVLVK